MENVVVRMCILVLITHALPSTDGIFRNYAVQPADESTGMWLKVLCDIRRQKWADYELLVLLSTLDHMPNLFTECLDIPVVILTNQGPTGTLELNGRLNRSRVAAVVFVNGSNPTLLQSSLKRLPKNSSLNVVITLLFVIKKDDELREAVSALWSFQLINGIILYPSSLNKVTFYRYYPFSDTRCECPGSPVSVAEWSPGIRLTDRVFADNTIRDLSGCHLLCGTFNHPPSIIFINDSLGPRMTGVIGKIADSVMASMNFKCRLKQPDDGKGWGYSYANGTSYGLHGEVSSGVVHVGFADFINDEERWKTSDLIAPYRFHCLTLAVPSGLGSKKSVWFVLVGEFSKEVWIVLGVTLTVSVVFTSVVTLKLVNVHILSNSLSNTVFFSLLTFLGAPVPIRTIRNVKFTTMRPYFSLWLLFSMLVGVFYMAAFSSLVTVPHETGDIDTLEQLFETNITVATHPTLLQFLSGDKKAEVLLAKRFRLTRDNEPFLNMIKPVASVRDRGVFFPRRSIMFALTQMSETESKKIHVFKEYCLSAVQPALSGVATRKGSALTPKLNWILKSLVESGLVKHWINSMPEIKRELQKAKPFTMNNVISGFLVLGIGLVVSLLVFCGEFFMSDGEQSKKWKEHVPRKGAPETRSFCRQREYVPFSKTGTPVFKNRNGNVLLVKQLDFSRPAKFLSPRFQY